MFKRIALIAVAGLMLCGCTIDQLIGSGAAGDTKKAAVAAISTYVNVVQPSMLAYRALPDCAATQLPTCKTAEGVAKVQAIAGAADPVVRAANVTISEGKDDAAKLMAVVNAVTIARAELGAAGIVGAK